MATAMVRRIRTVEPTVSFDLPASRSNARARNARALPGGATHGRITHLNDRSNRTGSVEDAQNSRAGKVRDAVVAWEAEPRPWRPVSARDASVPRGDTNRARRPAPAMGTGRRAGPAQLDGG